MKPNKQKIIPCIITSREGLESTVADIVRLKIERTELTAAMEAEVAAVQKRHQEGILAKSREIQIKEAGTYVYCHTNRATLFPAKKSIDMLLAVVGFETNPPSVDKARKSDTWSDIAIRLQSLDWGKDYVVDPDPEVSKSKLIADRTKLTSEQLAAAGIKIEQDEQFYIRPKSEVAEQSVQQAA